MKTAEECHGLDHEPPKQDSIPGVACEAAPGGEIHVCDRFGWRPTVDCGYEARWYIPRLDTSLCHQHYYKLVDCLRRSHTGPGDSVEVVDRRVREWPK